MGFRWGPIWFRWGSYGVRNDLLWGPPNRLWDHVNGLSLSGAQADPRASCDLSRAFTWRTNALGLHSTVRPAMTITIPKWLLLTLLVATLSTTAWFAGEKHRENCQRDGKRECSVLPWESGRKPQAEPVSPERARALEMERLDNERWCRQGIVSACP